MRYIFGCLLLVLAVSAQRCFADTFYQYNLSDITFIGNSVCGLSGNQPCVETFSASFELDVVAPGQYGTIVPGTASITSTGPLGTLYCCGANLSQGFVGIFTQIVPLPPSNPQYTEFDILGVPSLSPFIEMYACTSATCSYDFCTDIMCSQVGSESFPECFNCGLAPTSGTVTASLVPEPSALLLLFTGIIFLFAFATRRWPRAIPDVFARANRNFKPRLTS